MGKGWSKLAIFFIGQLHFIAEVRQVLISEEWSFYSINFKIRFILCAKKTFHTFKNKAGFIGNMFGIGSLGHIREKKLSQSRIYSCT